MVSMSVVAWSCRDQMIVAWQFIAREIGPNKNRPVRVRCDQE